METLGNEAQSRDEGPTPIPTTNTNETNEKNESNEKIDKNETNETMQVPINFQEEVVKQTPTPEVEANAQDNNTSQVKEKTSNVSSSVSSNQVHENAIPKYLLTSLKKERSVNPTDWDAKIDYWSTRIKNRFMVTLTTTKEVIRGYCNLGNEIEKKYYSDWERVLGEMEKRVIVLPLDEYEKNYDDAKKESFGSWLWNRVGWFGENAPNQTSDLHRKYINMELLKQICIQWINDVYEHATNPVDLIYSPSQINQYLLQGKFSSVLNSEEDLNHIINFIHQEGPATIIYMHDRRKGLLFSEDSTFRGKEPISQSQYGVAQIKETLYKLEKQITELGSRITGCTSNVRKLLQQQNRAKAKWEMGRKRMFEKALERRRASYQNLEEILTAIQSAHSDTQVLDALKSGTSSLKALTVEIGDVENTLEEMTEVLSDYRDIQDIIDTTFVDNAQVDDSEILDNLKKLSIEVEEGQESPIANNPNPIEKGIQENSIDGSNSAPELETLPDIKEISCSTLLLEDTLKQFDNVNVETLSDKQKDYHKTLTLKYKLAKMHQKKRKRQPDGIEKLVETVDNFKNKIDDFKSANNMDAAAQYTRYISILQTEINEMASKNPELKVSESEPKKVAMYPTPSKESFEEQKPKQDKSLIPE